MPNYEQMNDHERKNFIASTYPGLDALANEVTLNLSRNGTDYNVGVDEIESCIDYLKINANPLNGALEIDVIGDPESTTSIEAFTSLFDKATDLRSNEANYLTGLKFHYGINDLGTKIVVLYQPVLFYRDQTIDLTNKIYNFKEKLGSYYIWDGANIFVKIDNPSPYFERYRTRIKIKHFENANHSDFIQDTDTERAIFSFQEIFRLIRDNLDIENLDVIKNMWVYNAVLTTEDDPAMEKRHSLLLSSEVYQQPLESLRGKFANLAHLCPPNCKVVYRLF